MIYYFVEPEVAGGWGPNTVATRQVGRPTLVTQLHYVFDGWLGDELLESTPCFIATERLARTLSDAKLTGFLVGDVEVSRSSQFLELHGDVGLPNFVWLKIDGKPGSDDLGIGGDMRLVVSQTALDLLQTAGIAQAVVIPA
jgi:hypothetical protein